VRRALIGHTGFVGSTLARRGEFTDFFNSSNFRDLRNQRFDEVVCAGISAVKWLANKEPEADWTKIRELLDVLSNIKTSRFTLISTIDVYPDASQPLDERCELMPDDGQPYGRHRREVELFVMRQFEEAMIARLPALFGTGLKKNVIFDLLTGNQVDRINPSAAFQWYPLKRLGADLELARKAGLKLVNLFPEPLATAAILKRLFPDALVGEPSDPAPHYRLRTVHADIFGGTSPYLMPADAVMADLECFVDSARLAPARELG
jgi:hypothetical protein